MSVHKYVYIEVHSYACTFIHTYTHSYTYVASYIVAITYSYMHAYIVTCKTMYKIGLHSVVTAVEVSDKNMKLTIVN